MFKPEFVNKELAYELLFDVTELGHTIVTGFGHEGPGLGLDGYQWALEELANVIMSYANEYQGFGRIEETEAALKRAAQRILSDDYWRDYV